MTALQQAHMEDRKAHQELIKSIDKVSDSALKCEILTKLTKYNQTTGNWTCKLLESIGK